MQINKLQVSIERKKIVLLMAVFRILFLLKDFKRFILNDFFFYKFNRASTLKVFK